MTAIVHADGLRARAVLVMAVFTESPARAAHDIDRKLYFQLSGWSAFYKHTAGSGTVRCSNGQSMHVHIRDEGCTAWLDGSPHLPAPSFPRKRE